MNSDNIFSGLKVVDLASFIAGPGAAVILSDFGADVIKVEPPTGDTWRIGYKIPPQPRAKDNYPWHLNNRNKRGLALDLKSPEATEVLQRLAEWAHVLSVNPPNATLNVYRAADDTWFLIVLTPDKWPALVNGIGRPDLLTDARFADPAKQAANSAQLTAILDQTFAAQPMAHWHEIFGQA